MGKIQKIVKARRKLLARAHKFNLRQQELTKIHPAVFESMELLADRNLVWDDDFEAIRLDLLRLINAEARTGLHIHDLETLCKKIADAGDLL